MRRRVHLAVGILCGVVCVAGILAYTSDLESDLDRERAEALARYGGEQVEILVATDDVAVGDTLDSTNSEKRLWLSELIPEGAVSDGDEVASLPATSPIYAGEVVLKHRFDEHETVALQVPDGKCAVSVPAKAVSTVGGSIAPGSYVDVYSSSGSATDLLASRVLVLSTSTTIEEESEKKSEVTWVTLAVGPDAVEELITASQKSELYFVLPADGNDSVARDAAGRESPQADSEGVVETPKPDETPDGDAPEDDLQEKPASRELQNGQKDASGDGDGGSSDEK
ncbi:MAG: Flp pilus assembly protein CpaB [Slackia sp.]|nr:Flp pilus assembly protein CpaB [Slackia sp.]